MSTPRGSSPFPPSTMFQDTFLRIVLVYPLPNSQESQHVPK
jgi:hypothetical protein